MKVRRLILAVCILLLVSCGGGGGGGGRGGQERVGASRSVALSGILSADGYISIPIADPTEFSDLVNIANVSLTVEVTDSIGRGHGLELFFFKIDAYGRWYLQIYIDGGEVGFTSGRPVQLGATQQLRFDDDGELDEGRNFSFEIPYSNGAEVGSIEFDLSELHELLGPSYITDIDIEYEQD